MSDCDDGYGFTMDPIHNDIGKTLQAILVYLQR